MVLCLGLNNITCNRGKSPIDELISEYCKRTSLICLDEFQVTDIADAMVLRSLLSGFLKGGITMVTTSNRHPDGK
jgi:predicted ATPase